MRPEGPRDLAPTYHLKKSAWRSLWQTYQDPPPQNPKEFLTRNFWPWFTHYLGVMIHKRHGFKAYTTGNGLFTIPNTSTVAVAADWGTGTIPAYKVANQIRSLRPRPDVTIHMGDVYYSGTAEEYQDWFLGPEDWPRGSQHTFALNANHEMYSGGNGYFDTALGALKQETSYLCVETEYWRIVALDSGYFSGIFPLLEKLWRSKIRLHDSIITWLDRIVFANPLDTRPVVILTHHQPFSAFGPGYGTLGKNLQPYLARAVVWLWGHEHRFAGYGPVVQDGVAIRGRCIGHGGMPIEVVDPPTQAKQTNLVFYDERVNAELSEIVREPVGYCGFAVMHLDGPVLGIEYIDEDGRFLFQETWSAAGTAPSGSVTAGKEPLTIVHPHGLEGLVEPSSAPAAPQHA